MFFGSLFLLCTLLPASANAPSPVAVSVFKPIQYPSQDVSIKGIRVNFFYGVHRDLTGLDLGFFLPLNILSGNMKGIQYGYYNQVDRNTYGFQWGIVNFTQGQVKGIQFALGNITSRRVSGIQVGLVNRARFVRGVQIGVFNYARTLRGLQIGLSNLRSQPPGKFPDSTPFRFFPLMSWSF